MTATNIFYNFVGFRYSPALSLLKQILSKALKSPETNTF